VARLTRDELLELAERLDDEDLAILNEVVQESFVVEADAFGRIGYSPHPGPQTELHRIPAFSDGGPWDVLYGGAMGGGKTYGLLLDVVEKALRHPRFEGWFVRQTYRQLERDVFPYLEAHGFFVSVGGRWNANRRELRFPNASKVVFVHARSVADATQIRGECQYLAIDERSLIPPDAVDALSMRIRSGDPDVPVYGVRSGTNPGGVGHSRLKETFIDPAPGGRAEMPIVDVDTGKPLSTPSGRVMTRYMLPSTSADNPSLDETYYLRFSMMGADARAAYRDGDWSRFEGMRFSAFNPRMHIGDPADWPIDELIAYRHGIGVDFGSSAPFSAIWAAQVRSDLLVVYREAHQAGLTPTEQAQRILRVEAPGERDPDRPPPVWIDPSTWAKNPDQPRAPRRPGHPPAGSIADRYQQAGVPVRKAHNDRVTGWSLIDELLAVDPDDPDPQPRVVILSSCPNLIRSLTGAPRDEKNPEDVDGNYTDDHDLDAFRYLVMGLFGKAPPPERRIRNAGARAASTVVPTGVR